MGQSSARGLALVASRHLEFERDGASRRRQPHVVNLCPKIFNGHSISPNRAATALPYLPSDRSTHVEFLFHSSPWLTYAPQALIRRSMRFIDKRIADATKRLDDINREIEELRAEALSVRGELRAYQIVRDNDLSKFVEGADRKNVGESHLSMSNISDSVGDTRHLEKIGSSRLSPVWRFLFSKMVSAYPKEFTQDELAEIGKTGGFEPGPSFRTALWHHAVRNNLVRSFDDTFVANETTAKKAGVRWTKGTDELPLPNARGEDRTTRLKRAPPGTVKPAILNLVKSSNGLSIVEIVQKTGFKKASTRATLHALRDDGDLVSQDGRWFGVGNNTGSSEPKELFAHQERR